MEVFVNNIQLTKIYSKTILVFYTDIILIVSELNGLYWANIKSLDLKHIGVGLSKRHSMRLRGLQRQELCLALLAEYLQPDLGFGARAESIACLHHYLIERFLARIDLFVLIDLYFWQDLIESIKIFLIFSRLPILHQCNRSLRIHRFCCCFWRSLALRCSRFAFLFAQLLLRTLYDVVSRFLHLPH